MIVSRKALIAGDIYEIANNNGKWSDSKSLFVCYEFHGTICGFSKVNFVQPGKISLKRALIGPFIADYAVWTFLELIVKGRTMTYICKFLFHFGLL